MIGIDKNIINFNSNHVIRRRSFAKLLVKIQFRDFNYSINGWTI